MTSVESAKATAAAMVDQSRRLGLTWQLTAATVDTPTSVVMDGGSKRTTVVSLVGPLTIGARVMCLVLASEGSIYVIGGLGNLPTPGSLVARVRQSTPQTFTNGANNFINFDTVDYDPWGGFSTALPDRYTFQFPGIFLCNGRVVWTANATSRRAAFLNLNGTTSGTGTVGGTSMQTPAAGSAQVTGAGVAIVGAGEYVGLRGIQNSGGNLDTLSSGTDGGSTMEVIYLGQSYA